MTANTVNGSGKRVRSGAQTLVLLAAPINVLILQALTGGPKRQAEIHRVAGSPAQTTLRAQLKRLVEIGAIEKQRRNRFPGVLEYELTAAGRELLLVIDLLEHWLSKAPAGRLSLGDPAAKSAIKALAEGWSTTIVRVLAARPLSLTELDNVIGGLSYPSLERRLSALRLADLIASLPTAARGTPYTATEWLRQGVAPLIAAARWERRHQPRQSPPVAGLDIETTLLLAVPLLRLPTETSGSCQLAAELSNGGGRLAGATVEIEEGKVTGCSTRLEGTPTAWALGSVSAWLSALVEHDIDSLELGGNGGLARTLIDGINGLFQVPVKSY